MTRTVRLLAPAKINLSLEVLRIRPDGYHELRSVLQTVDLHDIVTIAEADEITLEITGDTRTLAGTPIEENLAHRAAVALRDRAGARAGARIVLEKRIPVAAGLGGGSSDAAAVLRGLNELWGAHQSALNLTEIAGEVGSDPPFFVTAGTSVVWGRGDQVEPLPDALVPSLLLATPREDARGEKTASMFAALTPAHFSDGDVTIGVREVVVSGRMIADENLNNVFDRVVGTMQPATELAMDALRAQGYVPHLAGAGPSFFLLYPGGADVERELAERVDRAGFEARPVRALSRAEALRIEGA